MLKYIFVFLSFVCSVISQGAPVYPSGLISYWNFDESKSGTGVALDIMKVSNSTLIGGAIRTTGIVGIGAVKLTGNSNQCILPTFSNITQASSFSLEIALKISSLGLDAGLLFKQWDFTNTNTQLLVTFRSSWATIVFGMNEGVGGYNEAICTIDPTNFSQQSHTVIVTYDGVNLVKTIYIDGNLCTSVPVSVGPWNPPPSSAPLTIGCSATSPTSFTNSFGGTLDEVAMYGYALSSTEVQNHYSSFFKKILLFCPSHRLASSNCIDHCWIHLFTNWSRFSLFCFKKNRINKEPPETFMIFHLNIQIQKCLSKIG